MNLFPIDHHTDSHPPRLDVQRFLESADLSVHPLPTFAHRDQALKINPLPEGNLEGISGLLSFHEPENRLGKERTVHAEVQPIAGTERLDDLPEDVPEESDRRFSIMDIPRTILNTEKVARLSQVGGDRIVTRHLPMVRVVSAEGTFHRQSRREYRTIHIAGERTNRQGKNDSGDDFRIQATESFHVGFRESLQPATDRLATRKLGQRTKPANEGIAAKEIYMSKSSSSHEKESQKKPNHRYHVEIPRQGWARKMPSKGPVQLNFPEITVDQLKSGVGSQASFREFDSQFSIDSASQIGFSLSHRLWPFVEVDWCVGLLPKTTTEGPFQYQIHQLFELFMENQG